MKPNEFADWLKSTSRYVKVTSLRINGDDARTLALNASAKRFATAEQCVRDMPGVEVVEALDANRNIVGVFKVADAVAPPRALDAIESSDPQSPAGLMAAYARHLANAYRDGGNAVREATRDATSELTGLVRSVIDRLNALEEARTREMNARAKVLERMQESAGDGDGAPSFQEMAMLALAGRLGITVPGAPTNGSGPQ